MGPYMPEMGGFSPTEEFQTTESCFFPRLTPSGGADKAGWTLTCFILCWKVPEDTRLLQGEF